MVTSFSPFRDMVPGEFERITRTVYLGMVHGTRSALDRMVPRDRGRL